VILRQDDCAPDSDWYFMQDFPSKAGIEFEDFKKAARCRIVETGTEWLINDIELSRYADDPFYTLRRKPQDPTPPAANTGITVASGFTPRRCTTAPHAWRLARKDGELILQGLIRCDGDQYGYREYWETIPTIDLTDEESES
jgi:hypothetical protein